jgi:predicted TIM-barrel fold metal-dependent hydrolase
MNSASTDIQAIDVHAHYGRYVRDGLVLQNELMSASAGEVSELAARSNTKLTFVSPLAALMPRGHADVVPANDEAFAVVAATPQLRQYVVIHPLNPQTYRQAERMLQSPLCVGIKIHPEEHCYHIAEHGGALFDFAAEHHAVVMTHSGECNSLPADFVTFADERPQVKLILAHLGCGHDGDLSHQVRAIQSSRHGNIFVDTSSASSITGNLIEWAVREVGAERILYGTDSPLYFAPMQRARIDQAGISDAEKRLILRDNALRIFGLSGSTQK